ncbi:hypothetical protein DYZ85_00828 [Listeria monocytogenes]|uniref:hypothetical protein n=1 Tax=Listeria monocytogenes TaxID=1639 RepID=UPI000E74D7C3|nr:hypothetical protein [Listeria monocytogenes]EAE9246318.1 hypothetical protein [Listeria monocytogenes]EAK8409769.1 hypothetical protein [Listeria monocytogenes]RKA28045.1 hypothetical protein DYZ85_00828 [Listeria monocytogenes]
MPIFLHSDTNWVDLITAFGPIAVALVTIVGSQFMNNKAIRANVVSKERARWLENHKSTLAEFLSIVNKIKRASNINATIIVNPGSIPKANEIYKKNNEKIMEAQEDLFFLKEKLVLEYSANIENDKFTEKIDKVVNEVKEFQSKNTKIELDTKKAIKIGEDLEEYKKELKDGDHQINLNESLENLRDFARTYYNKVWIEIKRHK